MVRRGSTVRVRQRALQSPCKSAPFLTALLAELPTSARYGAVDGASRFRTASSSREIDAFSHPSRGVQRDPGLALPRVVDATRSGDAPFSRGRRPEARGRKASLATACPPRRARGRARGAPGRAAARLGIVIGPALLRLNSSAQHWVDDAEKLRGSSSRHLDRSRRASFESHGPQPRSCVNP